MNDEDNPKVQSLLWALVALTCANLLMSILSLYWVRDLGDFVFRHLAYP